VVWVGGVGGWIVVRSVEGAGGGGKKGEVTFSLRPRRGRSLAPPFPPVGLQNVRKEV